MKTSVMRPPENPASGQGIQAGSLVGSVSGSGSGGSGNGPANVSSGERNNARRRVSPSDVCTDTPVEDFDGDPNQGGSGSGSETRNGTSGYVGHKRQLWTKADDAALEEVMHRTGMAEMYVPGRYQAVGEVDWDLVAERVDEAIHDATRGAKFSKKQVKDRWDQHKRPGLLKHKSLSRSARQTIITFLEQHVGDAQYEARGRNLTRWVDLTSYLWEQGITCSTSTIKNLWNSHQSRKSRQTGPQMRWRPGEQQQQSTPRESPADFFPVEQSPAAMVGNKRQLPVEPGYQQPKYPRQYMPGSSSMAARPAAPEEYLWRLPEHQQEARSHPAMSSDQIQSAGTSASQQSWGPPRRMGSGPTFPPNVDYGHRGAYPPTLRGSPGIGAPPPLQQWNHHYQTAPSRQPGPMADSPYSAMRVGQHGPPEHGDLIEGRPSTAGVGSGGPVTEGQYEYGYKVGPVEPRGDPRGPGHQQADLRHGRLSYDPWWRNWMLPPDMAGQHPSTPSPPSSSN